MSWLRRLNFQFQRISLNCVHKIIKLESRKMPFYAVARGRTPGIFMTWGDCEAQVKGFSGARYKKFDSIDSAQAFVNFESGPPTSNSNTSKSFSQSNFKSNGPNGNNLKRNYSTSSSYNQNNRGTSSSNNKRSKSTRTPNESNHDYPHSDYESSDDDSYFMAKVINEQLDNIEKKVKSFERGINKITKDTKAKVPSKKAILIDPPQPKKRRSNSARSEFEMDNEGFVQVYTDGACSSNGCKGARAGLGVFWGDGHSCNTSQPVLGRATNNCGEIQAATCAIKQAVQNGITKLAINTDSQFLINSVTKWMPGWKRKGWKLQSGEPVKNEKDFKELDNLQNKLQIKWKYVEAHRGIHGNEMADKLAKDGASKYQND